MNFLQFFLFENLKLEKFLIFKIYAHFVRMTLNVCVQFKRFTTKPHFGVKFPFKSK